MASNIPGIINMMEVIVERVLNEVLTMPNIEVCRCARCRLDIITLALNKLSPKYVVTEKGRILTELEMLEGQYRVDTLKAVLDAVEKVSKRPAHPPVVIPQMMANQSVADKIAQNMSKLNEMNAPKKEPPKKEPPKKDKKVEEYLSEIDKFLENIEKNTKK